MSKEFDLSRDGSFDYTLKKEELSCDPKQIKVNSVAFSPKDLSEMRLAFICEYGNADSLSKGDIL